MAKTPIDVIRETYSSIQLITFCRGSKPALFYRLYDKSKKQWCLNSEGATAVFMSYLIAYMSSQSDTMILEVATAYDDPPEEGGPEVMFHMLNGTEVHRAMEYKALFFQLGNDEYDVDDDVLLEFHDYSMNDCGTVSTLTRFPGESAWELVID